MSPASGHIRYVLITPARNEERFIEKTIQSVVGQTVLPSYAGAQEGVSAIRLQFENVAIFQFERLRGEQHGLAEEGIEVAAGEGELPERANDSTT